MTRIPLIEWEDASPEVKEVYEDIIRTRDEGLGVPFKGYANSIDVLKANWQKHKILLYSKTSLPSKLKQSIQLVVSEAMGCEN